MGLLEFDDEALLVKSLVRWILMGFHGIMMGFTRIIEI